MNNETAEIAEAISGDKQYQERARRAFPILVRQALAHQTIYYADLARELEMPNPRNLNYVLGSVGKSLVALGSDWNEKVPPLQCLVINQTDELPGEGVGWFITKSDFRKMTRREQRVLVDAALAEIYSYPRWLDVLRHLQLPPPSFLTEALLSEARRVGGGESEAHKQLKEWVAANPAAVGASAKSRAAVEYPLPSGDTVDVLFQSGSRWTAVEVKSRISSDADVLRGMFQCVKYRAVIEAMLALQGKREEVTVLLALESTIPIALKATRAALGVTVIEGIGPFVPHLPPTPVGSPE